MDIVSTLLLSLLGLFVLIVIGAFVMIGIGMNAYYKSSEGIETIQKKKR